MRLTKLAVALLAVTLFAPAGSLFSQQPQIVTGTRTGAMSIRVAVPEFELRVNRPGATELIDAFNETLWDDLDFSGILTLVSRSFYPLGQFGRAIDIDTAAWTTPDVDAQFLAFGNGQVNGGGVCGGGAPLGSQDPYSRPRRDRPAIQSHNFGDIGSR